MKRLRGKRALRSAHIVFHELGRSCGMHLTLRCKTLIAGRSAPCFVASLLFKDLPTTTEIFHTVIFEKLSPRIHTTFHANAMVRL